MIRRLLLVPAAVAAALAVPTAVSANNPTFTVDCAFATFEMPSTIAGTTVTAWLDGQLVTSSTATVQGQSIVWHRANPNYWEPHTWRVLVDAPFGNDDEEFVVSIDACRTDTPDLTVPPTTSTSTVPPAVPSSTVAPTSTTPPVVTSAPPLSTTPRQAPYEPPARGPATTAPPATVPATTLPWSLPETGGNITWYIAAAIALTFAGMALTLVRRGKS
jgi:LPXTG-motif cell wall-anchored protein